MADMYVINKSTLTAIGDSIREMTGRTTDTFAPGDMPTAIRSIEGGGGGTSSDERVKYVTFMNGDTELYKYPVIVGDVCKDPYNLKLIDKPEKEQTVSTVYTFNGWSRTKGGSAISTALYSVTEDRTVWAAFESSPRIYTISYYDTDGTWLADEDVEYGKMPTYTPQKPGVAFGGWTPEVVAVTGDASYTVSHWVESIASGTLSDTVLWNVTGAGALEISGTGEIPASISSSPHAYFSYADQITSVVVKDGITRVGNRSIMGSTGGLNNVTRVTFADSVTVLGEFTCYAMKNLERINWGKGITKTEYLSFQYCDKLNCVNINDVGAWCNVQHYSQTSQPTGMAKTLYLNGEPLTDLVIPEGTTSIANWAFYYCENITSVTLNTSLTSIGQAVFSNCTSVTNVYVGGCTCAGIGNLFSDAPPEFWVDDDNTAYSNDDNGVLFDKNKTVLFMAPRTLTQYSIPNTVTRIEDRSMCRNTAITSITIPNSVTYIGAYAFGNNSSLTSITIPNSVTTLGSSVISGTGITTFTIPDSVTGAISSFSCAKLTEIYIGTGITSIGSSTFSRCSALTKATFGDTTGWYATKTSGATSGTNLTLTNTATNATYLKTTYSSYYWYKK